MGGETDRPPTIRDIARIAQVSAGAVSLALNNKPGVSDETRQRIADVAASVGWKANVAARALSSSKAGAIGLVLARPRASVDAERFYFQFICGVESVLTAHDHALVLQMVDDVSEELDVLQAWRGQRRVDAAILVDPRQDDPRPERLRQLRMPFVTVGSHLPGGGAVLIDDSAMLRAAVDHLAERGRRRVAYVSGYGNLQHTHRRQQAFLRRGEELGITTCLSNPTDYSERSGAEETRRLLTQTEPPDGFIFDNEMLTLGGLSSVVGLGLRIPQDLSFLSLEDSPVCRVVTPQITAFLRDPALLGAAAATLLIEGGEQLPDRVEQLDAPQLAVRASTG
ncbi:MAG: LacI family DNA-binding transcriptional regulator [Propionibacteriaceae bacterium]|nr:LacI family DNA-binding transcriptional regulator [Propionibacteriaceae bacterium]